jgi:hypothetical protein
MPVTEAHIDELEERGFVVIPGFLSPDEIAAAQEGLWEVYPKPEGFFAHPEKYPTFETPMRGLQNYPWSSFALNRLPLHPGLLDAAERILGTPDIQLCKAELLAKYAGAADYEQDLHRDYGNHTLVVPRQDGRWRELTTILYLDDVTPENAAPAFVPRMHTDGIKLGHTQLPDQSLRAFEEQATGPAGSLVLYFYDVFHRAVRFAEGHYARFVLFADYRQTDMVWTGKHAFPVAGNRPPMNELVERIDARQRTVLGFPAPGHEYWNEQTLADTQIRYPNIDLEAYREAMKKGETTSLRQTAATA